MTLVYEHRTSRIQPPPAPAVSRPLRPQPAPRPAWDPALWASMETANWIARRSHDPDIAGSTAGSAGTTGEDPIDAVILEYIRKMDRR